jgi:hypothetical protein
MMQVEQTASRPSEFEGLLLAVCVVARPVVLAPFRRCARPGPSTPDGAPGRAARGGGSCGSSSRTAPSSRGASHREHRYYSGSGLLLVRVMREGARAAPAPLLSVATRRGAVTSPAPFGA